MTRRKPFGLAAALVLSQALLFAAVRPHTVQAAAAADTAHQGWHYRWSGFVNPHYYADSREVVGGREAMMLFYPKQRQPSADGDDLNAVPSANLLAITARLGLRVDGPDMLGAHTMAYIEGDFTGASEATINNLRLRHAYMRFDWQRSRLIAGQYWHPLVVPEIMPNTRPLNMGAPFHPYCRQGMVSYWRRIGQGSRWDWAATLSSQLDNVSSGPLGGSTTYARHSLVPEANLTLRYNAERLLLGGGVHCIVLRPRTSYADTTGALHAVGGRYASPSFTLFAHLNLGAWSLRAQYLYANNLSEIASMGGYVETAAPGRTGAWGCLPHTAASAISDRTASTRRAPTSMAAATTCTTCGACSRAWATTPTNISMSTSKPSIPRRSMPCGRLLPAASASMPTTPTARWATCG